MKQLPKIEEFEGLSYEDAGFMRADIANMIAAAVQAERDAGGWEMKYLIKNQVINADHIVRAQYIPEDEQIGEASSCLILTDEPISNDSSWTVVLRGTDADRFWDVYSSDAYTVVNP